MPRSKRDKKISLTKVNRVPKDKPGFVAKVSFLFINFKL